MGTLFWYLQRLSAVVILSYVLYVAISFFVKPYNISAAIWSSDIDGISFKIFSTLFLLSMYFHGIVGLKLLKMTIYQKGQLVLFRAHYRNFP